MSRKLPTRQSEVRLFVSYAHKDSYWMQALMPLLTFPGVQVKPWSDKEIRAGVRWDNEIKQALAEMDVFVALVSVHFAVSEYIGQVECSIAKQRHENDEIEVVPVLVHDPGGQECDWLLSLQRVPPGARSWAEIVQEFQQHDMALAPIRSGLREVIERARERRKRRISANR